MANESRVYVKFNLRNQNEPAFVDFSDPVFKRFDEAVENLSYAGRGEGGNGEFELIGRWTFHNNLQWRKEIEAIVNALNSALIKKKIIATHLIGDYCDMDVSMETCLIGRFEINIIDSNDNFDLYKVTFSETPYNINEYAKGILNIDLSESCEDESDEDDSYENSYEEEVWESLVEAVNIQSQTVIKSTNTTGNEKKSEKEKEIEKKEFSLELNTLFNPEFILEHVVSKSEKAVALFELYKENLKKHVFLPEFGWDLPVFHMIRMIALEYGTNPPNGKPFYENVGGILISIFDYAGYTQENYRNENIFFTLLSFPIYSTFEDAIETRVSEQFNFQLVKTVEFLIGLGINPTKKNKVNYSFYDYLCQKPEYYIELIKFIEASAYFERNNNLHQIFYRHIQSASTQQENLFQALLSDENEFLKLAKKTQKLNFTFGNGLSFLILSLLLKKEKVWRYLIELPFDLDHCSNSANEENSGFQKEAHGFISFKNPLISAILTDNEEAARILIKKGANVNFITGDYKSPLYYAIIKQNVTLISDLMDLGASLKFNELRHNLGLSDVFMDSLVENDEYNEEFWEFVLKNKLYKNYGDVYGNTLIFYKDKFERKSKSKIDELVADRFMKYPWLSFQTIPNKEQNEEMMNLLFGDIKKVKAYISKNKLNFNTKMQFTKSSSITVRFADGSGMNDDTEYNLPILIYWFLETVKDFNEEELNKFKKLYMNFCNLGYDVNTSDTKVSSIGDYKSVGNRNLLLTVINKISALDLSKRNNAYSFVRFLIDNGSNPNSMDRKNKTVVDYLMDIRGEEQGLILAKELMKSGSRSGSDQLKNVGITKIYESKEKIDINSNQIFLENELTISLQETSERMHPGKFKIELFTPKVLTDEQSNLTVMLSEGKDKEVLKLIKTGFQVNYRFDKNVNVLMVAIMFKNTLTAEYLIEQGFPLDEETTEEIVGDPVFDGQMQPKLTVLKMAEMFQLSDIILLIKKKMRNL